MRRVERECCCVMMLGRSIDRSITTRERPSVDLDRCLCGVIGLMLKRVRMS